MMEKAYRYESMIFSSGCDEFDDPYPIIPSLSTKINCIEYDILKFTPKGMWININDCVLVERNAPMPYINKKFVLLTANKKFANTSKEKALKDFICRKKRQIEILQYKIECADAAKNIAELELDNTKENVD